jgi:hypothetical protein
MVCVSVTLIFSCKSTGPSFYSFSEATNYTILGEVTWTSSDAIGGAIASKGVSTDLLKSGGGYTSLLAAAREKYPDCDYVIDIMVDTRVTNYMVTQSVVYIMRGTAIKYR